HRREEHPGVAAGESQFFPNSGAVAWSHRGSTRRRGIREKHSERSCEWGKDHREQLPVRRKSTPITCRKIPLPALLLSLASPYPPRTRSRSSKYKPECTTQDMVAAPVLMSTSLAKAGRTNFMATYGSSSATMRSTPTIFF